MSKRCEVLHHRGYTPTRITKIRKTDNTKNEEQPEPSITVWECALVYSLCKTVWQHLLKLNVFIAYGPATLPLNTFAHRCSSKKRRKMLIAALFVIDKSWKLPSCPSKKEPMIEL